MKIAVIGTRGIPGLLGGVERHCEELYPRLVARGAEVVVFARDKYVSRDQFWDGVQVACLPTSSRASAEAITHTCRALFAARSRRPDIVHIHSIGPASLTGLARLLGMRTVVTVHAPDYLQSKWGVLASAFLRLGETVGVRNATEVISVSRHYAERLEERYGRRVNVIPNGPSGVAPTTPGPFLASLGLAAGRYALCVGRLTPDKRIEDLIAACTVKPTIPLAVVGGPLVGSAYADDLRSSAGGGQVVYTGALFGEELAELYTSAGVYVLPSAAEGLSMSLLEAMAYGVPCVASDIPANRELLGDGVGALVPVGHVDDLRAAVLGALSMTPDERSGIGDQLRSKIDQSYDWESIADQTIEVYRRVTSSGSPQTESSVRDGG